MSRRGGWRRPAGMKPAAGNGRGLFCWCRSIVTTPRDGNAGSGILISCSTRGGRWVDVALTRERGDVPDLTDRTLSETRPLLLWVRGAVPVAATLLGMTTYLRELGSLYSWWIVFFVSPLALAGAAFAMGFLWIASDTWWARSIFVSVGAGGVWTGITEPDRVGTFLMGIALLLIGLSPCKSEARQ